jgi:hypothetical protein
MIAKRIKEGEIIPAWYGVAWVDLPLYETICLPLGLNLLASIARNAYIAVRHGWRSCPISPRDAYNQGLRDGRRGV